MEVIDYRNSLICGRSIIYLRPLDSAKKTVVPSPSHAILSFLTLRSENNGGFVLHDTNVAVADQITRGVVIFYE